MKRFVFAALAAGLLAACAAAGGGGSNPSPSASRPAPGRFDVTVTETTHLVSMRPGQTLEVVLHAAGGMNGWTVPRSSDETVLLPIVDPGAAPAIGVTLAAFRALAPGQAALTATASPRCTPGHACPMYVALYSLKVTVSG